MPVKGTPPKRSRPPRGQHFLHDQRILERIASSLPIRRGSHVVEIGAGTGALTSHLLEHGARVTALEIDPGLASELRRRHSGVASLEVVEADVLKVDLGELIAARSKGRALVAGNLPYYITSPILRRILSAGARISQAVLLMQKEVALRVVAEKGTRAYGFLTVLCQFHAKPEYLFSVPVGAFRPAPKVTSAAVRLTMRRNTQAQSAFVEFLKSGFRHPRKTLLNNLTGAYDRPTLATLPLCRQRAQELGLEELRRLWQQLVEGERVNREP